MRRALLVLMALSAGCLPGLWGLRPEDDARLDIWSEVSGIPSPTTSELPRRVVSAPGRTDGPNGAINGFCPPRAEVFDLGDDKSLTIRDPCSGTTMLAIHDGTSERPVGGAATYGAGSDRRVWPLGNGLLLVMFATDSRTLLLVDPVAATAGRLKLPRELTQARGYEVSVVSGRVFIRGGTIKVVIGSGGCENPPPNMGCDPYVVTKDEPNGRTMTIRPTMASASRP